MLKLLNNPTFDNERNVLNADLFVNNLKNTLKGFDFNLKVTYEVYRMTTVYHLSWNDDKTYDDVYELRKEIALSLGVNVEELELETVSDNEIKITVQNMKKYPLTLKELLSDFHKDEFLQIPLGLDEADNVICLDLDKDKNLLVTGVTGSGKTNLFNSLIMSLLINYDDVKIVILDSQGINYHQYDPVSEVVTTEELIIDRIRSLRRDFERQVKKGSKEKVVIFIDEIYELLKKDMSIKDDINYLLEVGSTTNMHLIISTDSVMDDDIYDLFKKNQISKLSLYLTSRGEYHMFLNEVVNDSLHKDGIYVSSDKKVSRLSLPLVSDDEIGRVTGYISKNREKI